MPIADVFAPLLSHLLFISLAYQLLTGLFDWGKLLDWSKPNQANRLNLFLVMLSVALGYVVSSFFISLLTLGQDLVGAVG